MHIVVAVSDTSVFTPHTQVTGSAAILQAYRDYNLRAILSEDSGSGEAASYYRWVLVKRPRVHLALQKHTSWPFHGRLELTVGTSFIVAPHSLFAGRTL